MYRPARFLKKVRVLTFRDVNLEEVEHPELRRPTPTPGRGVRREPRAAFLGRRGARLVARNVAVGADEIDLLVAWGGLLVAVEVKTRLGGTRPRLHPVKAERFRRAGQALRPRPGRYDLVTVCAGRGGSRCAGSPGCAEGLRPRGRTAAALPFQQARCQWRRRSGVCSGTTTRWPSPASIARGSPADVALACLVGLDQAHGLHGPGVVRGTCRRAAGWCLQAQDRGMGRARAEW